LINGPTDAPEISNSICCLTYLFITGHETTHYSYFCSHRKTTVTVLEVADIPPFQSALNLYMNAISICKGLSQIPEYSHYLKNLLPADTLGMLLKTEVSQDSPNVLLTAIYR
jgi:hypothetical protein